MQAGLDRDHLSARGRVAGGSRPGSQVPPRGRRSPHRPPANGGGPALAMRPSRPRRSSLEAGRGRGGGAPPPAGFWWRAKMGGEGIEGPATMQRSSTQIELTEGPRRRGGRGPRPARRPRADDLRSPPRPLRRRSEHLKRLVNTHVTPGKQYRCKFPCLRPSGLRGSSRCTCTGGHMRIHQVGRQCST